MKTHAPQAAPAAAVAAPAAARPSPESAVEPRVEPQAPRLHHRLADLRVHRPDREPRQSRDAHGSGCGCAACRGGAAAGPAGAPPAAAGEVLQLCSKCGDPTCKLGAKCSATLTTSEAYSEWDPSQKTSRPISTPWGTVSGRHNRGAPYLQSKVEDYGGESVGFDYADFTKKLKGTPTAPVADEDIAEDLLSGTSTVLTTDSQKRAAAHRHAVVGLGEEFRKQGASKIDRSLLRRVKKKEITLDKAKDSFAFVKSADAGRRQVARIQDVRQKRAKRSTLSSDEQGILDNLSSESDWSSDDELRKKKTLKKRRLFSSKHDPPPKKK